VRHARDNQRHRAVAHLLSRADAKAGLLLDQAAVNMDEALTAALASAVNATSYPVHRMPSGAGHDAMVIAPHIPSAMLFLRSPGGISHHPDELVLAGDVEAALFAGTEFLSQLEAQYV
jgi:allantoate deiminase